MRSEGLSRRGFLASALGAGAAWAAPALPRLKVLLVGVGLDVLRGLDRVYRLAPLPVTQGKAASDRNKLVGLERASEAGLWVGSTIKHLVPSGEQLKAFVKYLDAGKPVAGFRAAHHSYYVGEKWRIDREVFGVRYGGHHLLGKEKELTIEVAKGAGDHPILKGLKPPAPTSGSYVHRVLSDDVKVLLFAGRGGDRQPHTWVREVKKTGGRVFYTRYDYKQIRAEASAREFWLRGVLWALGKKA